MRTNVTPKAVIRHLFFMLLFMAGYIHLNATTHTVTVQNYSFTPDSLNAAVGDTITWQWINGFHTTTSTSVPTNAATWNASITSSSTSFTYVITQPGTYRYYCSVHNFTGVIIASAATAVEKIDANAPVLIYPKPFTGKLTVDFNANNLFTSNVTVEVYDILGSKKFQRRVGEDVSQPLTMDLSDLPQGVYFVAINNGKDKATFKVTKL